VVSSTDAEEMRSAGFRPLATCSPANSDLVSRFGAEKVFDYHSPKCADDIRAYTRNQLEFVLDCVTTPETTQLCYAAIGRGGGRYVALDPFVHAVTASRAATVDPSWFNVRNLLGREEPEDQGPNAGRLATPEDLVFCAEAIQVMQGLLDRGLVHTHPTEIMPDGWDGVVSGLAQLRKQAPSAVKMVYTVSP
jgi:NADPH:quinone reductase-like Zn-dependent oxidoreductase